MIEANNPEINVDELMQKIREEVAKRHAQSRSKSVTYNGEETNMMPSIIYIEALLKNAESRACIRTKWPEKLNRFPFNLTKKLQKLAIKIINFLFKDQREVNFNLIQSLKESVALNRQLIEQTATLRAQMDERLCAVDTRLQGMDERLCAVDTRLQGMDERLCAVDTRLQGMDDSFNMIDTWMSSWMTGTQEHFDAVDNRVKELNQHFDAVDNRVKELNQHFDTVDNRVKELNQHFDAVDIRIQGLDQRYIRNDSYLKNDLMQQKRLITMFLEEAGRQLPKPLNQKQLQGFVNEGKHSLDAFYVAFEDQFRGSREEIKKRLSTHISFVEKAVVATDNADVLDIGCGRGEWIELLSNRGFNSSGLDINRVMVQECQELGLKAILGDALHHLRSVQDNSFAVVSAFHVIEHLPLEELIFLIDEALRVLRPGGCLILETPNPENLIVGACNFYFDPTHRNPIPPATAHFILENRGFVQVEIDRINRSNEEHNLDNLFLNNLLLSYQDYAVIGWKL